MQLNTTVPGIIYGPVNSRRFGLSLGLNLSGPEKNCSFNCLYCFRGFNPKITEVKGYPDEDEVETALESFLRTYTGLPIVDWTIAGNGEPTDNPRLPEIITRMVGLRNRLYPRPPGRAASEACDQPGIQLTLLTNGMGLLPARNVRYRTLVAACRELDRVCLKLDSGCAATWARLNNPAGNTTFAEWFAALQQIERPLIQIMLVTGRCDNTTPAEISALQSCLQQLRPREIQVLTIDKPPADFGLRPVTPERLEILRQQLAVYLEHQFCP